MASTYSPNLRIELIATGEQSNTWGVTTNSNLGTLIEQAISGVVSVSVTAGDVTLTALNGATDQSRQMIIIATGTPGVARVITAPAVGKVYVVHNNSDASLSFIASGGTGVTLIVGAKKYIYCDGTNFYEAIDALTVTSGTIDGATIGATTATTGKFTTVQSTVATGTAPFIVASTTAVANLTASNVTTNANLTGGVTSVGNAATVVTNANLTGAVTSVGNATSLGSFTSAQLATALTDETGTGANVFATSPTLVTPNLGTPTTLVGTNITGTAASLTAGNATTASILNGTWDQMPSGTRVPFAQAAAPTGWTQDTSSNADNRMLRVVNTTGGGVAGSDSPIVNSTTMVAHTHVFTGSALGNHTHTDAGHTHTADQGYPGSTAANGGGYMGQGNNRATGAGYANISSVSAGTPAGSNSTTTGVSWTPRYIDMIICAKN